MGHKRQPSSVYAHVESVPLTDQAYCEASVLEHNVGCTSASKHDLTLTLNFLTTGKYEIQQKPSS